MTRSMLAALFLLPGLCACGGVGSSNSGALPQGASTPLAADGAIREAQSDSARLLGAPSAAGPSYRLYVANAGNNSITVYHANASGDTSPIATIVGPNTQLNNPGQLSEDANGDLYVANKGAGPPSSILVFAHGANGNVAPIRVISGSLTGLTANYLDALTVDQRTGKIFAVVTVADAYVGSKLLRFPSNASGDEAPLATGGVSNSAYEIALDSTGNNIIEAGVNNWPDAFTAGVYTFEKFWKGAGPSQPYYIWNFGAFGIADDPMTETFLVAGDDGVNQGIFRFQEDTIGLGAWDGGSPSYNPAVVSVITNYNCSPPIAIEGSQLALGHDRSIYVAGGCAADAVYVYEHDASGNATPLRVLTGTATNLNGPSGIYEGK